MSKVEIDEEWSHEAKFDNLMELFELGVPKNSI